MRVTKTRECQDMTPAEIAEALESIPMLEHWIRSLKAHAYELARSGVKIPGFKIGYGVRKRIWIEGQEAELLAALHKAGVKRDEVYTKPELLSPPQVEKHLKAVGKFPAKPRGGERPPSVIDPFITKSMPEQSLVRENEEPEPEQKLLSAQAEFKAKGK